jgi:hypothetical protein
VAQRVREDLLIKNWFHSKIKYLLHVRCSRSTPNLLH